MYHRPAPKTLADFFGLKTLDPRDPAAAQLIRTTAFLISDPQREFTDPAYPQGLGSEHTDAVCTRIVSLKTAFGELGIPTYIVYYDRKREGITKARGGLHRIKSVPGDIEMPKFHDSAFPDTPLEKTMFVRGHRRFLLAGFYASACALQTAGDGVARKLGVCALEDGLGDRKSYDAPPEQTRETGLRMMCDRGAVRARSEDVLSFLRQVRALHVA